MYIYVYISVYGSMRLNKTGTKPRVILISSWEHGESTIGDIHIFDNGCQLNRRVYE